MPIQTVDQLLKGISAELLIEDIGRQVTFISETFESSGFFLKERACGFLLGLKWLCHRLKLSELEQRIVTILKE
jgi:hypothetical protein